MTEEYGFTERVPERPSADFGRLRDIRARDLGVRFLAGALTSAAAGGLTLLFGAGPGGVLLAFPAILAASLTLIEEQEDSAEAREDARGAVVGAAALAVFAGVAAALLGSVAGAVALLIAAVVWAAVAVAAYCVLWLKRGGSERE